MAIDKIIVEFQAETTKLKKELDALKGRLGAVETDAKKAKDKIDDVGKGANGLKGTLQDLGKTIAAAFAVQQLVSFGREAVNAAAAFDKSMSNVATLVDTNVESMDSMGASVRDLAKKTPVELGQLSSALYDVRSAGVSAEDAMAVLESSAQLGVAGLATTAEAANIMTSAVNAFAAEGLSAEQISDILFKTVKAGKTTLAELTAQFGGVAPAAAAAGVSLADLQASTAAITTLGTPAAAAQTQLKQALTEMQKPGKELSNIFKQLGAKDGIDLIKTSGGLGNAFKLIKEEAEASGMTVAQVTGSVETASAILALGGTVNESYTATLADMTTGSNAVNGAFEKQAQTADAQFQLMQNAFEDVKIEIGNALMPVLLDAAEGLRDFMGGIDEDTVRNLGKALAIAAAGFAGFKFGQLVQGLAATIQGMKGATLSVQGLSKAIAANPFGLIASAVAALIAYGPDLLDMFSGVTELQKDLSEVSAKATENLRKEQSELNLVAEALAKTNPGSEERAKLLQRFNELSPVAIKDLQDESKFNNQLKSALDKANTSFEQRIRLRAAEAVAQRAGEAQVEAEARAIEIRDKLLKSGLGINSKLLDEYAKRAKKGQVSTNQWGSATADFTKIAKEMGIEIDSTGWRFSDVNGLIADFAKAQQESGEAGEKLASVQRTISVETEKQKTALSQNSVELVKSKKGIGELSQDMGGLGKETQTASGSLLTYGQTAQTAAAATKASTDATAANTDKTKDDTKAKEIAKTALEKLNQELAKLKTAQENATFAGDIEKASEYQKAISKLENQLAIFKNKLEEVRGGIVGDEDLEALDKASDLSFDYADKLAKEFGLIASSADLGTFTDEDPTIELPVILTIQEKAKQDALKKIGEIETEMGEVFGAVNSVLGPAMDALNGYFDLQLNNLEKEKNERLANENLTAEERLRIEEEYEAKKNAILAEQFEVGRASQIINATMSAAQAALNAFAATAAIPLIGPGVAAAAAAVAGAFGALQIGIIAAQPNPYKFFEGTPYLQLGGNPKGKDTIPVMAHEGEAIIPTGKNLQYPGLAKSWIDGSLDGYINKNFVRPALMEQQRQAEEDFADRLANSMALQMSSNFDDYRLHRDMKEQTAVLRDGFQTMKQTRKKLRGA
jgi:TP901 family phage tail tape measure protein